ncbi:MAG: DMT family transporter [Oscillospiraceae bacterium]|nr:DMT family transporter [Oscillospiraceae bacterium]
MYYILSLLSGVLISVMVAVNGGLSDLYGLHWATVFIHITGLILIGILVLVKRENPFASRHPWFLYLGGAIGVLNVLFANLAFGRISISAILALGLLGQSISGLLIDHFGLWGLQQRRFSKGNLAGLILILVGIAPMLTSFEFFAMLVSFGGGISVVLSRTLNAKLSDVTTVRTSTFFNYIIGLAVALPVFLFFETGNTPFFGFRPSTDWFLYTGGLLGVVVIMLANVLVLKVSAFYLTLLLFIGQVFTGILIDTVLDGVFSFNIFLGGVLVSAGLVANQLLDRRRDRLEE